MNYKHTQIGYIMWAALIFIALIYAFTISQAGFQLEMVTFMFFILFILASFSTLQVSINGKYLKIKYSYGIFIKHFRLSEIKFAKAVKNHWYFGWGLRYWFWPKMWIFNISGFDAVEIMMKNGKRYRIGTDEPKKLENAILKSI